MVSFCSNERPVLIVLVGSSANAEGVGTEGTGLLLELYAYCLQNKLTIAVVGTAHSTQRHLVCPLAEWAKLIYSNPSRLRCQSTQPSQLHGVFENTFSHGAGAYTFPNV